MVTKKEGTVRFAVIGIGHIGRRHAEMIAQQTESELVAVCDVKSAEALQFKPNVPLYADVDEMLRQHTDLDVVTVATPNGLHKTHALKVLQAGYHVVVEKPMALSKADAEEVIYTALHKSRHVFGVMQNRYSPPSVWIKELIESKRLGRINMVQINCYWNRDERYYTPDTWHGDKALDGGTLFTQFSHFIDIMYWLFGDITNISARINDFNHQQLTDFEDSGIVSFDFVNGGMGVLNFSTSCWNSNFESSLTILAENGTVKIGGQYMNEVEYCHVKDYELPELPAANPPNNYGNYKGSAANHSFLIQNVVDVLKGRDTITTNALEGLKVVEIIERIYKSV